MKLVFISVFCLLALSVSADPIKIYETTHKGIKFRHFSFTLTPENTYLPGDKHAPTCFPDGPNVNYREVCLNERATNFNYGQFEVYVPATKLNIKSSCQNIYKLRMPQSDPSLKSDIIIKKKLYFSIMNMVKDKAGNVDVVLQLSEGRSQRCNLFFRSGQKSSYVDYIGPIR